MRPNTWQLAEQPVGRPRTSLVRLPARATSSTRRPRTVWNAGHQTSLPREGMRGLDVPRGGSAWASGVVDDDDGTGDELRRRRGEGAAGAAPDVAPSAPWSPFPIRRNFVPTVQYETSSAPHGQGRRCGEAQGRPRIVGSVDLVTSRPRSVRSRSEMMRRERAGERDGRRDRGARDLCTALRPHSRCRPERRGPISRCRRGRVRCRRSTRTRSRWGRTPPSTPSNGPASSDPRSAPSSSPPRRARTS